MSTIPMKTKAERLVPINGKLVSENKLIGELNALKSESTSFDKEYGTLDPRSVAKLGELEAKAKEVKTIENLLDSRTAFINESVKRLGYISSVRGNFSFGSACERYYLDANNGKLPAGNYENTTMAHIVGEGESVASEDMNTMIRLINIDNEDAIIIYDSLMIGSGLHSDDPDAINDAFTDNHEIRMENTESAKACETFMSHKDPTELDPMFLNDAINSKLSGKTRRSNAMMILTNNSGFSKLDQVDGVSGVSLIKKVNGEMIYRDKYVVQELPNEILPSNENGDPCIVGALTDICKIFVIRDEGLSHEDWNDFTDHNRRIRKEIIALTTTSDRGYIWGYLA